MKLFNWLKSFQNSSARRPRRLSRDSRTTNRGRLESLEPRCVLTPVVTADQIFSLAENSAATTEVGTVLATDGNENWTITAGNTDQDGDSTLPFAIDASTGVITVNDAGDLDREQTTSFTLSVTVSDGVDTSAPQTLTISLTDVNDVTPVVTANQSFSVAENSATTTSVGTVLATDGDVTLSAFQSWTITAGNTDKDGDSTLPFAIDASTGAITVNDAGDLDREQTTSFTLSVTVSDGVNTSAAQTLTISLTDVNDVTPVVTANQSFSVAENSAATTAVGTVLATDGDATLSAFQSWTITAGNTDKDGDSTLPFAINASTGEITVNDAGDLDREQTTSFTLSVTVSDGVNTSAAQTLTISLTDVNDVTPVVTANQSFSVAENSAATTAVGTVLATDGDVTATTFQSWTITAGNTDKDGDSTLPFAINASTGEITVNDAGDLDREQTASFTLSVTVSDGVNTSAAQTATISLTDVNDVTPVVTANQSFNVAENSTATTAVGTVLATDGDVTLSAFQSWTITAGNTDKDGDSTLPFAIDASTGAITVNDAGDLDREQTTSFTLSVTVSDGVNTSAPQTLTISLTDVNDVTPVVTANQSFSVAENSAATTAVGTVLATDGDVTATAFQSWTITAGNTDKDGDSTLPFAINASTGAITVNDAGDLDREQTTSFTLSVTVSDGVNTSAAQTLTISLTDVNDVTPVVTANQSFSVAENSAATTAVGTVLATDGDVTATTFQSWTITAGNTDKDGDSTLPFAINASTGEITVNDAGDLDREQTTSFTLSVTVSDGVNTSAPQTLTISLTDVNDVTPVVTANQSFNVAENSTATTAVGTVLATDGDVTLSAFQSWTITAGNTDKDGDSTLPFAIDASTGAITVNDAGDLDREQTTSFTLSVTVSDGVNTSAPQTLTISLTDVNDVTPVVTANQSFSVAENSAATTAVGTVLATDGDVTATTFQSWTITAGNTDKDGDSTLPFAINASTGEITVNDAGDLDREQTASFTLSVTVSDGVNTSAAQTATISLTDVNDVTPVVTANQSFNVAENSTATTAVGTVLATDGDVTLSAFQSWTITAGNTDKDGDSAFPFAINASTGAITVNDAGDLDREQTTSFTLSVTVSDGVNTSAAQTLTISLTDVNDVTPVVTANQSFSVAENSAATTAVGTVLATDGDATLSAFQSWTITAGNTDKDGDSTLPFAIDASTGAITVNDAGDLDREQTTSFTLSVTVSDGVNTSAAQTLTISLTDVNDVTPVVTANQSFSVAENSAATTAVGTVLATDGDVTATTFQSWTITAGNTDKDGDSTLPFAINASTGEITVNDAGDLDREQTTSFTLSVTVSDGVNTSAPQTLTISLTDVNDVTPVVTANQSFNVAENSTATTAVGTVLATDGDVTLSAFQSWTITAGNTDKDGDSTLPFAIDASTGAITVNDAGDLDREQTTSFTLSVTVSDGVNTSAPQTLTISLTDVNDVTPVVTANQSFSVAENSAATTAVGTVLATDGDVTATAFQSWTIIAGNTDKDGDSTLPFAINASTGAITVNDAGDLDREQTTSFTLSVTVSDGVNTSAAQTLTISLTDVNEVTPVVLVNVDGSHNLTITDFTGLDTNITVTRDRVDYVVSSTQGNLSLNGGPLTNRLSILRTSVTGGLVADLGAGDDKLNFSSLSLNSTVHGGTGNDSIQGGSGKDHLSGDAGNDTIIGNNGDDVVSGGTGTDSVFGNLGDDTLYEETDAQIVVVTTQSITGVGSSSSDVEQIDDTIQRVWIVGIGNIANIFDASASSFRGVTLDGGAGNDTLIGGRSNDTLLGGGGDDHLTGNAGTNSLNGGEGTDTLVESGNVSFTLTNNKLTGVGTDNLTSLEVVELTGGTSSNTFTVNGWAGTGTFKGNGGTADTISVVEDGNFTLTDTSLVTTKMNLGLLGFTKANLTGGVGTNVFIVSLWHGTGTMTGAVGLLDRIEATRDTDLTLTDGGLASKSGSGFGTLTLSGVETANLSGGALANKLIATAFKLGAVTLQGNGGDDVLIGGSKNDSLIGGTGRDLLIGGAGLDTLNGDAGEDILIGGTSTHSSNIAALNAIMAEWTFDSAYASRVVNLLNGGGANGTTKLNSTTVKNDSNASDSLSGSSDLDWFFQSNFDDLVDYLNTETKAIV